MRKLKFLIPIFLLLISSLPLQAKLIKTPAEQCNYTKYTQYPELTYFLTQLSSISDQLQVNIIGHTITEPKYDLYLCILTEEGVNSPDKLNREKPTLLITASQHGNEQSGKEAVLKLMRDIIQDKLKKYLKKINILIIPQCNPYGNLKDQRRNEQNLDLNRDHVKLESPEVEAIHHVFHRWKPEVTFDLHEKGYGYYMVEIGTVSNINIDPRLQEFARKEILSSIEKGLKKKRITFHEYLITQPMGIDSSAGVIYSSSELKEKPLMKRYSTTDINDCRNGLGIYNTLSFIQEISSKHDLESLKERTNHQYHGILELIKQISKKGKEIIQLVKECRKEWPLKANNYSPENKVYLRMKYTRDPNQPVLEIKKFERSEERIIGILNKDKKTGEPLTRSDLKPYPYPSRFRVITEVVENWFPLVEPTLTVVSPLGYIIPAEKWEIVEVMLKHGLKIKTFTKDCSVKVEAYRITEIIPAKYDYLPPQKIDVETFRQPVIVKKGSFYVSVAQFAGYLIPILLEPQSQYGLIRYWKFNLVPSAGDIFSIYRVIEKQKLPVIDYKNWEIFDLLRR